MVELDTLSGESSPSRLRTAFLSPTLARHISIPDTDQHGGCGTPAGAGEIRSILQHYDPREEATYDLDQKRKEFMLYWNGQMRVCRSAYYINILCTSRREEGGSSSDRRYAVMKKGPAHRCETVRLTRCSIRPSFSATLQKD
jgi:hypothetical protein